MVTPVETRERANRAQTELRAHGEELDKLRVDLIAQWIETDRVDTATREHLWQAVKTLDVVREALNASVASASVLDRQQAVRHIMQASDWKSA